MSVNLVWRGDESERMAVLGGLVIAVPLAAGIATGQSWTPYVTYTGWGVAEEAALPLIPVLRWVPD